MQGALGVVAFVVLAWSLSEQRDAIPWRSAGALFLCQVVVALLLFQVPVIGQGILVLNGVVHAIETATLSGAGFVFGYLAGADAPFAITEASATYIFAFRVLPQVLVFSVLVALAWYWRVLPWLIGLFARGLNRVAAISGAAGMAAASSVFLGMVEAPLVVRAYLQQMSRSELFVIMTCGMATVAGSIMVLYASVLGPVIPGALGHIIAASVVNVLGALIVTSIMVPPTGRGVDAAPITDLAYSSNMDAITRGTQDGVRLVLNVGAMLVVLVSLVALVNQLLGLATVQDVPLSLERIMGWVFAPVAWLMGIPWREAIVAGDLLGSKLILNELIAYLKLAALPADALSDQSRLVMTYALCGFANFGSLGIMLGGLTALAPDRREELLKLAPKTLISGTIVNCITGAIVALMSSF